MGSRFGEEAATFVTKPPAQDLSRQGAWVGGTVQRRIKILVQTEEQLEACIGILLQAKSFSWDVETDGRSPYEGGRLCGISFCTVLSTKELGSAEFCWYVPFRHASGFNLLEQTTSLPIQWLSRFKEVFERTDVTLLGHHLKHDISYLAVDGIVVPPETKLEDSMVMGNMLNENERLSLAFMCDHILGWNMTPVKKRIRDAAKKAGGYHMLSPAYIHDYGIDDARGPWYLMPKLKEGLKKHEQDKIYKGEEEFIKVLHELESHGIKINRERAQLLADAARNRMAEITSILGFTPTETRPLAKHLYKTLQLTPSIEITKDKTPEFPNGVPVMDAKALSAHDHPDVKLVLEYRKLNKANSNWYQGWLDKIDDFDRLHPIYNYQESDLKKPKDERYGAGTTRLTCQNPNIQQTPRDPNTEVRKLLIAPPGYELWSFDYNQIELRLAAAYANELMMIEALNRGDDLHQITADALSITRPIGKNCNFSFTYDATAETVSLKYDIPLEEAIIYRDGFHQTYPAFKIKSREAQAAARRNGYIKLWTGRRRHFMFPSDYYKAWNSLVQGGASEILRESMRIIWRDQEPKMYFMCASIHDQLIFEIKEELVNELVPTLKEVMEWPSRVPAFKVPFPVDVKRLA